ncbi:hypothetical protein [Thalassospira lucentensis]|uniref:hypothetical protein n=1 Tax=Thalassospira lucentensis TaxID=168935 RepID=UPI002943B58C|nr:hypothetical protein [Thalassospira lucentensis]WOI09242.1 hypothetical protein R1T41_11950 [Thalassospira lucentensis]
MPRISGPELRPDWVGTGSFGRVAGVASRIGCQRADGSFGDADRPVIDGGICVSAMRQRCCPWGEVRFGATESERRSGPRGPSGAWSVRSVAFGDAGGSVAGLAW